MIYEYHLTLRQEEIYWFIKSRAKWLVEGERNTHFFHSSAIIKQNKRKIQMLKDQSGEWFFYQERVKTTVKEFYGKLYTAEACEPCDGSCRHFPSLSHSDHRWRNHEVSAQEVKTSIFQMGPNKASGQMLSLLSFLRNI